jgi:hypothetical protein
VKLANGVTIKHCKPFQIVYACKTKPYMTGNPGVGHEMVLVEQDSIFRSAIEHIEGTVHLVEWDKRVEPSKLDKVYCVNNWIDLDGYWEIY